VKFDGSTPSGHHAMRSISRTCFGSSKRMWFQDEAVRRRPSVRGGVLAIYIAFITRSAKWENNSGILDLVRSGVWRKNLSPFFLTSIRR
jgi:hypothetical protein